MKQYHHIMVDLETMGNGPTASIIQIGACSFNVECNGQDTFVIDYKFLIDVDLQSCIDAGLTLSADTILWWMAQNEAPRLDIVGRQKITPLQCPLLLNDALKEFSDFVNTVKYKNQITPEIEYKQLCIWGHGSFDIPILINAFGKTEHKVPWHYRCPKDIRTLTFLSGLSTKEYKTPDAHNALADCLVQARYVIDALVILRQKGLNNE